ncbi:MAG: hypothetical protein MK160_14950 [Rhodobacteraceae bacterium]|nr:hypothetical protein [Paracoccaceae bacterium]
MRFAFIVKNAGMLPIEQLCQVMKSAPEGIAPFVTVRSTLSQSQRKTWCSLRTSVSSAPVFGQLWSPTHDRGTDGFGP